MKVNDMYFKAHLCQNCFLFLRYFHTLEFLFEDL